ncbi:MAG: DUF4214 domain-containing protein [Pseudomonadota bacterium]
MTTFNLFANSEQSVIERFFECVLFRDPTAGELADYTNRHATGTSYNDILDQIIALDEVDQIVGRVIRLYEGVFGRKPDKGGLDFWVDTYRSVLNGNPGETDKNNLILSIKDWLDPNKTQEFADRYGFNPSDLDFTTELYRNILGREPDQGGLNFWVGQLQPQQPGGFFLTREQLVIEFTESSEFIDRSQDRVDGFLENIALGTENFEGTLLPPNQILEAGAVIVNANLDSFGNEPLAIIDGKLIPLGNIEAGSVFELFGRDGIAFYNGEVITTAPDIAPGAQIAVYNGQTVEPLQAALDYPFEIEFVGAGYGYYEFDGKLYFSGFTTETTYQIFTYDVTEIEQLSGLGIGAPRGVSPGSDRGLPAFTEYQGDLYFAATTPFFGDQLHMYDGQFISQVTSIGGDDQFTRLGYFTGFAEFDGDLYFSADDGTSGLELWRYDGQSASQVIDLNPGAGDGIYDEETIFKVFDDALFFVGEDPTNGIELRRYDGNTVETFDLLPGSEGSLDLRYFEFAEFNDALYFAADTDATGVELFRYKDGDVELVQDINVSADSLPGRRGGFVEHEGNLYFSARQNGVGEEIHVYDGTNVQLFADVYPGFSNGVISDRLFTVVDGELYFEGRNDTLEGVVALDLNTRDARQVDIFGAFDGGAGSSAGFAVGDEIIFAANDTANGREPWVLDAEGARLLENVRSGDATSLPFQFGGGVYQDAVYFSLNAVGVGAEFYRYDGTNLELVQDIFPGGGSSNPGRGTGFVEWKGELYFAATSQSSGFELHKYDGSSVSLAAELTPGSTENATIGNSTGLIPFGDELIFGAKLNGLGQELYSFDGSDVTLLQDFYPGSLPGISSTFEHVIFDDMLVFTALDPATGLELYTYSGIDDGSELTLIDIRPGINSSLAGQRSGMIVYDDAVYFDVVTDNNGIELAKFDGQTVSTIDIFPGFSSSTPGTDGGFVEFNGKLIFDAFGSFEMGRELYSYDGQSVTLIADIAAGAADGAPGRQSGFVEYDGKLYFSAFTPEHGRELHVYDGNTVELAADIARGDLSSSPNNLIVNNGYLFFQAETFETGEEWYAYDGLDVTLVDNIGDGTPSISVSQFEVI